MLHPQCAGFAKAPYESAVDGQKAIKKANAKDLSYVDFDPMSHKPFLRMWTFEKTQSMFDKGVRVETHFADIHPGDSLNMFVGQKDFKAGGNYDPKKTKPFFDANITDAMDCIPAFTVLEITVGSKGMKSAGLEMNNETRTIESIADGTLVRITGMSTCASTLYSYVDSLKCMDKSLSGARTAALDKKKIMPMISKDIEERDVCFFVYRVNNRAYIDDSIMDETGMVRLVNWAVGENADMDPTCLDMPVETILRYTNSTSIEWSLSLLELAANLNCLSVLVASRDFWAKPGTTSNYRAVPVIDTHAMFQCITLKVDAMPEDQDAYRRENRDDGIVYFFRTGCTYANETKDMEIVIGVQDVPAPVCASGDSRQSTDLSIQSVGIELDNGYPFMIGLENDGDLSLVLSGFMQYNMSASGGQYKRRRLKYCM